MSDRGLSELRARVVEAAVNYVTLTTRAPHSGRHELIDRELVEAVQAYESVRDETDELVARWGIESSGVWLIPNSQTSTRKIPSIKLLRYLTGMQLRPAKAEVERNIPILTSDDPDDLNSYKALVDGLSYARKKEFGESMDLVVVL